MARRNPYHAVKGSDPRGKVCFQIYNEDGQTERYCYSVAKARKILDRLDKKAAQKARRANRSKKPQFANYNPARVEALKQKLFGFSSALSTWNLKYHEFPDIDAWLDKNWDAPYGRDVAKAYLEAAASRRSDNYWGTRTHRSRQDLAEEQDRALRLRGTFSDLLGDEMSARKAQKNAGYGSWTFER